MATSKPRITITLSQETYDAVKEFSDITEMSMSRVISEMTDQTASSLRATSALMLKAKNAPQEVLSAIAKDFDKAASDLTELADSATKRKDEILDTFSFEPPYINKGVRSQEDRVKARSNKGSVVSGRFSKEGVKNV